ncbi:MAG TPA: 2-aminoethylphosphonate--pyruvate transaminase [Vicinamibacterales bacterium]|nr:2-aminoethylphosphonate--pyruvate transaminase [Vicinamibacterales bacterium]
MARDVGSRDADFTAVVQSIRRALAAMAAPGRAEEYAAVLVPGSGTYAVEAALGTCVPDAGRLLIAINGAYGERMRHIAERLRLPHALLRVPDHLPVQRRNLAAALDANPDVTHVAVVHCETTTGLVNPLTELADETRARGLTLLVDAMSSFGALPIDMAALGVHVLMASSNKCIEGVPGLSLAIASRRLLQECQGRARSLSLDLVAQQQALDADGQFRFTPPTHVVLALAQAIAELAAEGGVAARGDRYARNQRRLVEDMSALGFDTYLPAALQGPIITTFHAPPAPFEFEAFYQRLHARGFVIYPGKLTAAATFRIGSIGQLFEGDMIALVENIDAVLREMDVALQRA